MIWKKTSFIGILIRIKNVLINSIRLSIGLTILILLIGLAVFGHVYDRTMFGDLDPTSMGMFDRFLSPSNIHPLGTDLYGRDVFALLIRGIRYSFIVGVLAGGVATLIAILVALTAGWMGGKVDSILSYITNSLLVIPSLVIMLAIAAYMSLGLYEMSLLIAFFGWAWPARLIRAQTLSIKTRPYIELAKITNESNLQIIFAEILPNLLPFIVTGFANSVASSILVETGLRLLGLGPALLPTIGYLIYDAQRMGAFAVGAYNLIFPPIIVLILIFMSMNLIIVGLDELFNPRLKKITGR